MTAPIPPSLHNLLATFLTPAHIPHLFPSTPTTPFTFPFRLSHTLATPTTTHVLSLRLAPLPSPPTHHLFSGLLHLPNLPASPCRLLRTTTPARSLQVYNFPEHDALLLHLSHPTSPLHSTSLNALFRRSTFLSLLPNPPTLDSFAPALLSLTSLSTNRITSPPPLPQSSPAHPDFRSCLGHFQILSTLLPSPSNLPGPPQMVRARSSIFFNPELQNAPQTSASFVDLALPSLPDNLEHPFTSMPLEDPLHNIVQELLQPITPESPTVRRDLDELQVIHFLGLPPPLLATEEPKGPDAHPIDVDDPHGATEAQLLDPAPSQQGLPTASPDPDFPSLSTGFFGMPEVTDQEISSLERVYSPLPAAEPSASPSLSEANQSAVECEDPQDFALKLKAEIRKERNRASALRSNMRKRAIRDRIKMELIHCREKVDLLRSREVQLRQENMRLRKRIMQGSGIVSRIIANSLI